MKAKFTSIMHYATRLVFFLHAQKVPHNYIPLSAKKKCTIVMKKVHEQVAKIKITSVGISAAKSNETR